MFFRRHQYRLRPLRAPDAPPRPELPPRGSLLWASEELLRLRHDKLRRHAQRRKARSSAGSQQQILIITFN